MAKLPEETTETINCLKQQSLDIVDDATVAELIRFFRKKRTFYDPPSPLKKGVGGSDWWHYLGELVSLFLSCLERHHKRSLIWRR